MNEINAFPKYEDEKTEFKIQWSDTAKKTLCAFLNSNGGTIYFGIDNHGNVIGVDSADQIGNSIANTLQGVHPKADKFVKINVVAVAGREVVVVHVQEGTESPYKIMVKGMGSKAYIRRGPATFEATEEDLRVLYQKGDPIPWESHISRNQKLTFNETALFFERSNVEFSDRTMPIVGLVNEYDDRYTNLAFLLSDQCTYETRLGYFKGKNKGSDSLGFTTYTGSLLKQFVEIDTAIKSRLDFVFSIGDYGERVERHPYPPRAIREALLNLFVHRDYSLGVQATVTGFEDRLEFLTIGSLPPRTNIAMLKRGVSVCRNEHLCNVFAKLGLIEKYGIGIPRIFASYENEYKEPLLECTDDMVCITLPKLSLSTEEASLSERQKAILSYIRKNQPVTRSVVQQAFALSYGTTTSELNKLVGDGLILKVGNGRSTKYAAN